MGAGEGGGRTDDGAGADEAALAGAVDEAMAPEITRAFVEAYQRQIMDEDRLGPPRDRQDEILDELRHRDPGDERPDA